MASGDSFSRASVARPREGGHPKPGCIRRAHACPDEMKFGCAQSEYDWIPDVGAQRVKLCLAEAEDAGAAGEDRYAVVLLGEEKKPNKLSDEKFVEKDEMMLADLLLALEDSVLFNVKSETTAKGLWDKLRSIYEGKSLMNKIFLRRQLYNLRMVDGSSVHERLNMFNSLISKLAVLDVKIEIEEKDTSVASLPNEEMRRKSVLPSDGDALVTRGEQEKARSKARRRNKWILDLGASFHMTPHREWFQTYSPCDGGVVYMGNTTECCVAGIGDVRIMMFDGCVHKFSNVRHVPAIRQSLLSLGKFDEHGLKNVTKGGKLKVVKGIMIVAKGELVGGIYRLKAIMSHNSSKSIPEGATELADSKVLMEAMMSEMRRVMRLELEQVHERIDRMENTGVEQTRNAPNVRRGKEFNRGK
ncbi:hypothetical protein CRG98_018038 [Punica granatum]|uniref:Retrovirus-related Pol polyprotein from transposon TNT 1-94-like beta-barrel domain-containing protein n=1 Tax=Punica granatum TaxID=22663 RepID=A0A2I0JZ65_PUNGR|nr:hypothetical protein CRG98_018038 [Punica granatum]